MNRVSVLMKEIHTGQSFVFGTRAAGANRDRVYTYMEMATLRD